ncbi:MAG: P-type DNA transfer protein VirB5 [Pusillimonas sp.]|nr:P-type DNA transfer protein VirB5 [Pusillimonas sp.]HCN73324.1 P-type DNA transfer protein VirB5 [Pusillimonas sp.]
MNITHYVRNLGLTVMLLITANALAQIPVTDSASITARALQHAESLAKYLEQIATLKSQLESAQRQYQALTGTRNLGDLLNNPAIRRSLPDDVQSVLKSAESSLGSIAYSVDRIQREEQLSGNYSVDSQALTQRVNSLAVRSKALLEQAQSGTLARLDQVDQLQAQINLASDPKAIADLQARLQIEQANIMADQMRADLLSRQIEAEKALIERQAAALAKESSFSVEAIHAPVPNIR